MKRRNYWGLGLLGMAIAGAAEPAKAPAPPPDDAPSLDDLYQTGKDLFDTYAPPEVKAQYEFPDRARFNEFAARLQAALDGTDPVALARYEPEARAALAALRLLPDSADLVDWLDERLDYIEAARQIVAQPAPLPVEPLPGPGQAQTVPHYALWVSRVQARPAPAGAARLVPILRPVFVAGDVPGALVWLAEVESSFNPAARSPVGARGLFQLMPATAKELGLSTFLPDERTDPAKSAAAASRLLHQLHEKFNDWPLALAAYNAGAGRVQRALDQRRARSFAEIAPLLSIETQLYVPKVLATLNVRAGLPLARLAPPRA